MRKPILLLFFVLFEHFSPAQPVKRLRVNPDNVRGGRVAQIFDSVTYIPLETTKESTFGSIDNLQVSAHYFVFFDRSTNAVFVFDKKGKFVSKITSAPNLPKDQIPGLGNYILNPFNESIYVPYYYIAKHKSRPEATFQVAVFNPAGQVSKLIKLNTTLFTGLNYSSFAFMDSNHILISRDTRITSNQDYFAVVKDFKEVVQNLVPLSTSDPFIDYSKNYRVSSRAKGYSIWTRDHDYDIVIMQGINLIKYRFIFPASLTMDSVVYKDTAMMKDVLQLNNFDSKHKDWIANIGNIYKFGNFLTFKLVIGGFVSSDGVYLMNINSGNLYGFNKITPDSSNGYLPIGVLEIAAADKQYIYSSLPSYELFEAKRVTQSKHPVYSKVMQQYFATENRKSNPVIVQLKPKTNL